MSCCGVAGAIGTGVRAFWGSAGAMCGGERARCCGDGLIRSGPDACRIVGAEMFGDGALRRAGAMSCGMFFLAGCCRGGYF